MVFTPIYLLLATLVLGMNIIPAFMPPTWMILAFFFIKYNLVLPLVVVVGAFSATLGRIILALLSKYYLRRLLSSGSKENMDTLGKFVNSHKRLTVSLVTTYAFLPIPSNEVFVAAGLAKAHLKIIALSFLIGRLVSYTFWVSLAEGISDSLDKIFTGYYSKTGVMAMNVISLLIIVLITRIGWKKVLSRISQ